MLLGVDEGWIGVAGGDRHQRGDEPDGDGGANGQQAETHAGLGYTACFGRTGVLRLTGNLTKAAHVPYGGGRTYGNCKG